MSTTDTTTRPPVRGTSDVPCVRPKRAAKDSCADRWVKERRANRPERPAMRLPAHAVSG